jgi:hypothetical protein
VTKRCLISDQKLSRQEGVGSALTNNEERRLYDE